MFSGLLCDLLFFVIWDLLRAWCWIWWVVHIVYFVAGLCWCFSWLSCVILIDSLLPVCWCFGWVGMLCCWVAVLVCLLCCFRVVWYCGCAFLPWVGSFVG